MDIEPAKTIIEYLGGAKAVSEIISKHPSRVYRWAYPVTKREGCGGIIPSKDQRKLLSHCRSVGIDMRPDDFFSHLRLRSILDTNPIKKSPDAPASAMVEVQSSSQCTSATHSHDPHSSSAPGGGCKTSLEPGCVKSDGVELIVGHGRESGFHNSGCNSEQAATHSDSAPISARGSRALAARASEERAATNSPETAP